MKKGEEEKKIESNICNIGINKTRIAKLQSLFCLYMCIYFFVVSLF